MLSEDIENAIKKYFEIDRLSTAYHEVKDEAGKIIREFRVNSLWIVHLPSSYRQEVYLIGAYITEYSSQNYSIDNEVEVYKGMLLIASDQDLSKGEFVGGDAIKPVNLDWPSSLVTTLMSTNFFPHGFAMSLDGYYHHYAIYTFTPCGRSHLQYRGTPQTENMEKLWEAIFETMRILANRHNIQEIHDFLKTQINYRTL
ncbi:MAG: hypothetical protein HY862_12960 [Chloroflexi bacterium]|nr:hypothetical protein [Chloroflexota bacterium]